MSFIELKIAFSQFGYILYKDRDYRGRGYFIQKDKTVDYAGSTLGEVVEKYLYIKRSES